MSARPELWSHAAEVLEGVLSDSGLVYVWMPGLGGRPFLVSPARFVDGMLSDEPEPPAP